MASWTLKLGLALALVAACLPVRSASAQNGGAGGAGGEDAGAPLPDLRVVSPEIAIPANGAILIHTSDGMPVVQVRAEGGATLLGGTLRQVREQSIQDWSWTPSAPFTPGRYEITLLEEHSAAVTDVVTAIAAIDLDRMPAPIAPRAERFASVAEQVFCVRWINDRIQPSSSFRTAEAGRIEVTSGLDPDAAPEHAHQFFYSVQVGDTHYQFEHDPALIWSIPMHFEQQSDRYCVSYRALRLADGEELAMELCAPHGDLPSLDAEMLDVPDSALERTICQGAPSGFEQRWCMVNRACDALSDPAEIEASGCGLYGAICRNECLPDGSAIGMVMLPGGGCGGPMPTVPWGGAGNTGGPTGPCVQVETDEPDASEPEPNDADASGDEDDAASTTTSRSGCGCSTIGSASPSYSWLASLSLSLIVALSRVRRRTRSAVTAA